MSLRPLHRVLLAIEAWAKAAKRRPRLYAPEGPTANMVDGFLDLADGMTRQLIYSVREFGYVCGLPPYPGAAQRLTLTTAGRQYLAAGCPMRTRGSAREARYL